MSNIKTIFDAKEFLETIPDINRGGCGIAALSLYRFVKQRFKKESKIIYLYCNADMNKYVDPVYYQNEKVLQGNNRCKPTAPSHCIIGLDDKEYDTSRFSRGWVSRHVVEEKFLLKTLKNTKSWNRDFDRSYIKDIEECLKIDLSDVAVVST